MGSRTIDDVINANFMHLETKRAQDIVNGYLDKTNTLDANNLKQFLIRMSCNTSCANYFIQFAKSCSASNGCEIADTDRMTAQEFGSFLREVSRRFVLRNRK